MEAHSSNSGPYRLHGLDGLRAVSIGFVILTHLGAYNHLVAHGVFTHAQLEPISGGSGVQIFFVISGYLITSLLLREYEQHQSVSIGRFLLRRSLRIFPLYFLFLSIVAALMLGEVIDVSYTGFWMSAVYLGNFVSQAANTGEIGHTWSLAVEEHFYLFWPLIFLFLGRARAIPFLVLGLAGCAGVRYWLGSGVGWSVTHYPSRWTVPAADSIIMGCLVAVILPAVPSIRTLAVRFPSLLAGGGIALFTCYVWMPGKFFWLVESTKALGVMLVILALTENKDWLLTRALESRVLRYLGMISYGLYIWQGLFLRTGPGGRVWFQQFPLNLALTFAVAMLSYHCYEAFFLRLKKRYARV